MEWERAFPRRIAQYFANYAGNYWMREPLTQAPDLLTHTIRMLMRVAVLRFLLFNHPALSDARVGESPRPTDQRTLDQAAVEVFYTFSRAVEHSPGLLELVHGTLEKNGLRRLDHALELARF